MGTHCDVASEFDNEVQDEQQKRHRWNLGVGVVRQRSSAGVVWIQCSRSGAVILWC